MEIGTIVLGKDAEVGYIYKWCNKHWQSEPPFLVVWNRDEGLEAKAVVALPTKEKKIQLWWGAKDIKDIMPDEQIICIGKLPEVG